MSKIDLSKAKVGDKFRTRSGSIRIYYECKNHKGKDNYLLKDEDGNIFYYHKYGNFILWRDTEYDLVEQVHDKPLYELIQEGTKQIKESRDAIEGEKELQRRQEVVELAEKMYIMFENENLRCHLSYNGSNIYCSEDLVKMAFIRAASFVNNKHKYLKDGKLC